MQLGHLCKTFPLHRPRKEKLSPNRVGFDSAVEEKKDLR